MKCLKLVTVNSAELIVVVIGIASQRVGKRQADKDDASLYPEKLKKLH